MAPISHTPAMCMGLLKSRCVRTSVPLDPILYSPAAYGRLVKLPKLNIPIFKFSESVVYPVILAFRFSPETLRAPLYKFKYLSCKSQSLSRPSTGWIIAGGLCIGKPLPLVCLSICSTEVGIPSKKYVLSFFHMSPRAIASSRLRFPTSVHSFCAATIFSRSDSRNCCWRVLVLPKNLSSRMRDLDMIPPSSLRMVSIIGGSKSADTELVKFDTPHGHLCSDWQQATHESILHFLQWKMPTASPQMSHSSPSGRDGNLPWLTSTTRYVASFWVFLDFPFVVDFEVSDLFFGRAFFLSEAEPAPGASLSSSSSLSSLSGWSASSSSSSSSSCSFSSSTSMTSSSSSVSAAICVRSSSSSSASPFFFFLFFLVSSACVSKDGRQEDAFDFAAVFLPFFGFLSFVSDCDSMTANAISMLSPARADACVSFFLCAGCLESSLSVSLLFLCRPNGTLTVLVVYPDVSETPFDVGISCVDLPVCAVACVNSFGISLCGVFGGASFGCAGVVGGDGAGLTGFGGGFGVCFGGAGIGFGLTGVCCSSADSDTWCARSKRFILGSGWDVFGVGLFCVRGGSGCAVTLFQWSILFGSFKASITFGL